MHEFCITINGAPHCLPILLLIDPKLIRKPPPENMPDLELALTVLELVKAVPRSETSAQFTHVANQFVQQFAKALPKGVELVSEKKAEHAVRA